MGFLLPVYYRIVLEKGGTGRETGSGNAARSSIFSLLVYVVMPCGHLIT